MMLTKPKIYTREFILKELKSMLQEIRGNEGIFYLGQVFDNRDYSMQRFSEWRKEHSRDDEISEAIEKIGNILETRALVGAMKKELQPTIVMFHLKNNYKWNDKVELTTNLPIPILPLRNDEKRHLMSLLGK